MMGHYRDKGYGMGHRAGHFCGLRGDQQKIRDCGFAFPDDPVNASVWRRWMKLLYLDQYGIFLGGALVGMFQSAP
ncbi:hypothetical protein D3C83_169000 [compost metagenome]